MNGRSLRTHSREVEGECLVRTGPLLGSEYRPSTLESRIKKLGIRKSPFKLS